MDLVSIDDVRSAADNLSGVAVRTPVVACPWLGESSDLWLKLENQQPIGAFKLRGAYHAISRLAPDQRARGVVTHSSGNHGQAVGYAARALGVSATVVMPDGSVPLKVERVRQFGARVELVPVSERLSAAQRLAETHGYAMIPPYDHPDVIAGQGTVGLEILEQVPDVAVILAPVGGGGLISGIATAVKALRPEVAVIGVEPAYAADAADSLRAGRLVPWPDADRVRTVADGLRTNLAERTFAHIAARVDDIVTVTDDQILDTVRVLARQANVVAEPSGAVTTAAYRFRRDRLPAGRTVAVVSGGNIDPALLATLTA